MNRPRRAHLRAGLAATAAAILLALAAAPASAHVEPSPASVEAGSSATISLDVEHGCGDSPLVKLEVKVPEGVTDAKPGTAPTGWKGGVVDGVITFTGGPQPAHESIAFPIVVTVPDAAGTSVGFPTIETCTEGTVDWLDPVVEGQPEPENPVPTVRLTAAGASAATTTTEAAVGSSSDGGSDDSSNTAPIVIAVIAAVVVVGGGAAYARSRRGGGTDSGSKP